MLTAVIAWTTSSIGKTVAKWGAVAAAIGLAYWRIRGSGRAAERADRAKDTLQVAAERESQDEISKLPDDLSLGAPRRLTGPRRTSQSGRPPQKFETMSSGTARQILAPLAGLILSSALFGDNF